MTIVKILMNYVESINLIKNQISQKEEIITCDGANSKNEINKLNQELNKLSIAEQNKFSFDLFWTEFETSVDQLCHENNKLAISFKKKPFPNKENAQLMCGKCEAAAVNTYSIFIKVPKKYGIFFHQYLESIVIDIYSSVSYFGGILIDIVSKNLNAEKNELFLNSVGKVFEKCDAVKNTPRTNNLICIEILNFEKEIILDAVGELSQAIELQSNGVEDLSQDDDFEVELWSKDELTSLHYAIGLGKTGSYILKKFINFLKSSSSSIGSEEMVLEKIVSLTKKISQATDDYFSSLYPPINNEETNLNVDMLNANLTNLLNAIKSSELIAEADNKWINCLEMALQHNYESFKKCIQ